MDEKKNNKGLKIAVAVMAVVIVALAGVVTAFLLKGDNNDRETSSAVTETESETEPTSTQAPTEARTTEAVTTVHISPTETVSFSMGSEKSDINEILDYDKNKTYKAALSDFAKEGDKIDSFVFVF